ncbi:MAG: formimidoylglutamase [Lutibacter sp.]|nr:formimidoylglutamase [Lutibacter sp.]
MHIDCLTPVDDVLLAQAKMQVNQPLGQRIKINTLSEGFPDLSEVKIVIVGVREDRATEGNDGTGQCLDEIRRELYKLYPGNWPVQVADLGDIQQGSTIEDTYFALRELLVFLIKKNLIPVVIGGGQDLTYPNYRAYDQLEQTVNLVAIDNQFNIGTIEEALSSRSYLSKIIMNKPNNLFNYSNIGYQTYFNSQEEIDLLESLFFEAYRLGAVKNDLQLVEPVLRDADIVSLNLSSVKKADAPANNNATPNGFNGAEICAIARYAGISDKVSSFGIYEYNHRAEVAKDYTKATEELIVLLRANQHNLNFQS